MPLSLSTEELNQLLELAAPIAYGRRREFLQEVAAALEACPQSGPGTVFRTAAAIQRRFTIQAQRVAPGDMPQGARQAGR
jgi:hypothetical protein